MSRYRLTRRFLLGLAGTVSVTGNLAYTIPAGDLPVGSLVHDGPATPEQISLWLPTTGVLPQSATATCRYRVVGAGSWTTGHPLYRVQPSQSQTPTFGGAIADGFAWPIVGLTSGTAYDVEVTVTDGPASVVKTLTHTTRSLPATAGAPNKTANSVASLTSQLSGLNPGDVLQIADGAYNLGSALSFSRSGSSGSPIYIRGQSREGVVISRSSGAIVNWNCSHVIFENVTLQGSGSDSGTSASSVGVQQVGGAALTNQTIRSVTITGVDKGISFEAQNQGTLVYDFTLQGNNVWTPTFLNDNRTWNDDGVKVPGTGNCVFNGTITGFGDSCAYAVLDSTDPIAVHFYRLEIRNSCDDNVEFDGVRRNCTFYDNRTHNASNALSIDEHYGGPTLYARNIVINPYRVEVFKIKSGGGASNDNSGFFLYSNTIVSTAYPVNGNNPAGDNSFFYAPDGDDWRSYGIRNNVFVYRGAGFMFQMTPAVHNPVDWTHNSWFPNRQIQFGGVYANLAAAQSGLSATSPVFSGSTQRMSNDNITVTNPWTTTVTLGATAATEVTATYTPQLASGTAKNSGVVIPNITDGFSGAAPDRGALMDGRAVPVYGDRTASSLPAWMDGQAVGEWRQVPNSAPSSCPITVVTVPPLTATGPQGKVIGYSGGCADIRTSDYYLPANGGHNDYPGNEINRIRLSLDAPVWEEVQASSPAGQISIEVSHYGDGRPAARHGYYSAQVITQRERVMLFGAQAVWGAGNTGYRTVDGWNLLTRTWDAAGTHPNSPSITFNSTGTAVCQNPLTGDVFAFKGFNAYRWNVADSSWTTLIGNQSGRECQEAATAYDTSRNRILALGGVSTNQNNHIYTIATNAWTGPAVSGHVPSGESGGLVYMAAIDSFLHKTPGSGGSYTLINASTMVGTLVNPATGGGIPTATSGLFNKLQYFPALGIVTVCNTYTSNVWALRVHTV